MTFLPSIIMFMPLRCHNKFSISPIKNSCLRLVSIHTDFTSRKLAHCGTAVYNTLRKTSPLWCRHWRRFSIHQSALKHIQQSDSGRGIRSEECVVLVADVIERNMKCLAECSIPEPRESVELFVAHVLGRPTLHGILRDKCLTLSEVERIAEMVKMRLQRDNKGASPFSSVPVQYILGEWDFCDMTLKMRPPVFIPRPETEQLVEFIKSYLHETQLLHARMLEVGCGSGAITLALLKEFPHLQAVAIDKKEEACDLTRENARRLGLSERLEVFHRDITEDVCDLGRFHLLVSNPPYISTGDINSLDPQVTRYEDHAALDGGGDGLDIVRQLLKKASSLLHHTGTVWLEVDTIHPSMLQDVLEQGPYPGLHYVRTLNDFTSRPRFCVIKYSEAEQ